MKYDVTAGATSEIWLLFIQDATSVNGSGLSGLLYTSSGLAVSYARNTSTGSTPVSLADMTLGTYTSGGFKEIDASGMKGHYQFCPPNASISSGTRVDFHLAGATNMVPLPIEVQIVAYNPQDAVRMGQTALPNNTNLALSATTMVPGTAVTGTLTTTVFTTSLSSSVATDFYKGRALLFTGGTLANSASTITAYTSSSKSVTVSPAFTASPSNTDAFIIV